jgi:hypothetical protein
MTETTEIVVLASATAKPGREAELRTSVAGRLCTYSGAARLACNSRFIDPRKILLGSPHSSAGPPRRTMRGTFRASM